MIRPTVPFIRWVAYVLVLPALLTVWHPMWMIVTAALMAALILVSFIDAFFAQSRLGSLSVAGGQRVRRTRGEMGRIVLEIRGVQGEGRGWSVALHWPRGFAVEREEGEIQWLENLDDANETGGRFRVSWNNIGHERGLFHFRRMRVGVISRLGWWQVWREMDPGLECRVYPSIAQDRSRMSALFLSRGGMGVHVERMVGQGREFDQLRDYLPGDGFEDVHWKATAKRGRPVTKVHQVERTQEVYMVLDHSRLMGREVPGRWGAREELPMWAREKVDGSGFAPGQESQPGEAVLERALSSALILAMAAEHQGDHFGLVTYADRVDRFLRARSGQQHFQSCREALYGLRAERVSPDYEELAGVLRMRLRKRALLVYVTALDDPVLAEGFLRHAQIVARQHLVLVCMPRPRQLSPLFEGEEVENMQGLYDRLGAQLRWNDLREVQRRLQKMGAHFHLIDHQQLSLELVTHYARTKARQLL